MASPARNPCFRSPCASSSNRDPSLVIGSFRAGRSSRNGLSSMIRPPTGVSSQRAALVALDDVAAARRGRPVLLALQAAGDAIGSAVEIRRGSWAAGRTSAGWEGEGASAVGGPWRVDRQMSGKGASEDSLALSRRIPTSKRQQSRAAGGCPCPSPAAVAPAGAARRRLARDGGARVVVSQEASEGRSTAGRGDRAWRMTLQDPTSVHAAQAGADIGRKRERSD
jgi:hypothetical protein